MNRYDIGQVSKPSGRLALMKQLLWIFFAFVTLFVGLYPVTYLIVDGKFAILYTKSDAILSSNLWRLGFYAHILTGGVALLSGWPQFIKSIRTRYPQVHRTLGKVYITMVVISGVAAICIAPFSSAGWIAGIGFGSLGVVWLYFTIQAYRSILRRDFFAHENQMICSYSACLASVTLRIWLPLLVFALQLPFEVAYAIVAWLCWVPNLAVAFWITSKPFSSSDLKKRDHDVARSSP